jgi:hypothetical protein
VYVKLIVFKIVCAGILELSIEARNQAGIGFPPGYIGWWN